MNYNSNIFLSFILVFTTSISFAQLEVSKLFDDNMVLQRNKPISVWGWDQPGQKVSVSLNNQLVTAKTDKEGRWKLSLDQEMAGGPFEMIIKGSRKITFNNVLIGEVWICSGQSNMEWPLSQAKNAVLELKNANYPMIRQFHIGQDMSSEPKSRLKHAKWTICDEDTAGDFTAVGYFFARQLYEELNVPIGLINSTWGGTNVETWTSKGAFEKSDEFKDMIKSMPELDIKSILQKQISQLSSKIEKLQGSKVELTNEDNFKSSLFDDSKWPTLNAPELWESQQLQNVDGTVWYRKSFILSKDEADGDALLSLAKIDDEDITYVNGVEVGHTELYHLDRNYRIPSNLLKEGKNVIAVRIVDNTGGGGVYGNPDQLFLKIDGKSFNLSGEWKFKVVEIQSSLSPNNYPTLLYNAMINPIKNTSFRGVIWYQGESNVLRAEQYKKAFPLMITDWRNQFKQGDFPFYFVQLSSFNEHNGTPLTGSRWAELREAQSYTNETIFNTGMAVTIDIGNTTDIHPTNKQDVGKRLAAIALHNTYDKRLVDSGPLFTKMEIEKSKVVLSFDKTGGGLMTPDKYGYVKGFAVAGADKKFHYAKAYVENNKVIAYHIEVKEPVAVRYAWADDAGDANLFNQEGFPAVPFRTDEWSLLTEKETYQIQK